jgi:hypothetical protein
MLFLPELERARRQNELRVVRETILRPQDDRPAEPRAAEEDKVAYAVGYIWVIEQRGAETIVKLKGSAYGDGYDEYKSEFAVAFPPNNNPEHLAELRRAQSSPHLRVYIYTNERQGKKMITYLAVEFDYYALPLENTPPFDTVKLEGSSTTAGSSSSQPTVSNNK